MPSSFASARPDASQAPARIDTDLLRQQHPIVELIGQYGIELRRSGAAFIGRCPFHADGGRPNLTAYPRSGQFVCYRCGARGDVIDFVRQLEHLSFREAAARLDTHAVREMRVVRRCIVPVAKRTRAERRRDPVAPAVLAAALELYQNRLLNDNRALAYLASRGFARDVVERWHVGFAAGGELVDYLSWRNLPVITARRLGLLDANGHERMAGRIVFPEIRKGQLVWLIGRLLDSQDDADKYHGLPGGKPLLGWDEASGDLRAVVVVEGPLDLLALHMWGVPGVATCGTRLSPSMLEALGRWKRLYVLMDADDAGREATARLVEAFGSGAVPVSLPPGVKDAADLAPRPDGGLVLAEAIQEAVARDSRSTFKLQPN